MGNTSATVLVFDSHNEYCRVINAMIRRFCVPSAEATRTYGTGLLLPVSLAHTRQLVYSHLAPQAPTGFGDQSFIIEYSCL
jgi:hypothetical protein